MSEHILKTRNDGRALLQASYASSEWSALVENSTIELPHERAGEKYRDLVLTSSTPQGGGLKHMEQQAAKR